MAKNNHLLSISEDEKKVCIDKLAEVLPILRSKMGVSQDQLSNMIGLSRQTYSTLENRRRKMTWSVFLTLIFVFDHNENTHSLIREIGVFPEALFGEKIADYRDDVVSQFISPDIRDCLDEQAMHAIETMIMVEYARCKNMSGDSVIKAFNGRSFSHITPKDIVIQKTLNALKNRAQQQTK